MAINIDDKGNVDGPGGNFEFSHIRDDSSPGSGDGTPVNTLVYGDFHQFFAKIIDLAGIAYNDLPENSGNGYQYIEALKKLFVETPSAFVQLTAPGTPDYTIVTTNAFSRKSSDGIVQFKGFIDVTRINPIPFVAIFQVLAPENPGRDMSLTFANDIGGLLGTNDVGQLTTSNGHFTVTGQPGTVRYYLDNMQYIP